MLLRVLSRLLSVERMTGGALESSLGNTPISESTLESSLVRDFPLLGSLAGQQPRKSAQNDDNCRQLWTIEDNYPKLPCVGGSQNGGFQTRCTKNRNEGTFGCSPVPKTGTRVHSDVPLYRQPERGHIRQNRPFVFTLI